MEHIAEIRRGNGLRLIAEVALGDLDQLGKEDVSRGLAAGLPGLVAGEVPRQLEDQRLETPTDAVGVEVNALELSRPEQ